jgi:hypothetical protein
MSAVHLNDRQVLGALLQVAERVLRSPFMPSTAAAASLADIGADIVAMRRCPAPETTAGAGEAILFAAVQMLASGGAQTTDELYRYTLIAQHALPIVHRRYSEIIVADEMRRAAPRAF